jgi:flagellar biosynthetic protein FlhB
MSDESGEKTEEPSEKKIQDARRKGQVANSKDMTAGGVFIAVFVTLSLSAGSWFTALISLFRRSFMTAHQGGSVTQHLAEGLSALAAVTVAPLVAGVVAAIALGFMQTGGLFAVEALKIDPQKLMPNFKKFVSMDMVIEVVKGFVKVALAAAVAWASIKPLLGALANLTGLPAMGTLVILGHGAKEVGNRMLLVVAVVGFGDFMWQRHSHMKKLRMSREEMKKEHKESEGDPHHKAERKRLHQEIMEGRMVNEVKKANFVVVNPTHIAVAIKYDREKDAAPVVLAKGELLLADRIRQAAREAGVPIFRDVSLARALRDVQEGDEIPEALYEAVAEILRHIYGDNKPAAAAAPAAGKAAPPAKSAGRAITSDAPRGTWRRG